MYIKKARLLAIILFIFSTLFLNAAALGFTPEIEAPNTNFGPNDDVSLSFIIKEDEAELILQPFKCEIKFDGNTLKYSKTKCTADIKRSDITVEKSSGFLTVIYSPHNPRKISFENSKSKIFEIVFTIKNKVCTGVSSVQADFKNSDSNVVISSSSADINIKGNPEMESCKLKALTPGCGNISPAFDPNVFDYTMEVPSDTQNIDFSAVPMNEKLSIKISRRKLAVAGQSTHIKVTVSDKSLRIKSVYNIEVKRLPEDDENKPKSNGKSKSEKKHKKPKESSKYDRTDTKESQEQSDELENENTEIQSNSDTAVSENSTVKIYTVSAFCLLMVLVAAYFIIRFIKSGRKLTEKPNNSINNYLKK